MKFHKFLREFVMDDLVWLKNNGFELVGNFVEKETNDSKIGVHFIDPKYVNSCTDWVYVICKNGSVVVIGETAQTLAKRIRLYYINREDSTNSGMLKRLQKLIPMGTVVQIYAQKAPLISYNNQLIKLRVDLEIFLIKDIKPEWNKKGLYGKG